MKRLKLIILLLLPISLWCQSYSSKPWQYYRHEITVGLGASNYLGELGGRDGKGSTFLMDLEWSQTKPAFSFGYRYNISDWTAGKIDFFYGKVSGSDQLTRNVQRAYRNLSFESVIIELAFKGEVHLLRATRFHRYYRKSVVGKLGRSINASLSMGLGFFYFNPKNGGVALQPLSTEGQGLPGGAKPYKRMAVAFPLGIEWSYQLSKNWRLGMEYSYRFTSTDYLDDASTVYYDQEAIRDAKGDLAAQLSNQTDGSNPTWSAEGAPRGNQKNKDSYLSMMVVLTYTPFHRTVRRRRF